ncbi:CDGSH iron-sulfur domain-containing protein [Algimonas porphyrae]|uniref:Iron-binding protein n=1 Tax=Algimonas porphyrae TaxID=1128113 RepID=A0ABQ5V4P9_9PROT|nr:CDGSH iron-sulfur domain-containing protein [Algimonas porphyrae]GLQ21650.1 iron-binding protein [Algimonas porphyrae]
MNQTTRKTDMDAIVSDDAERVEGKDVTLYFDGKRCIHARYCVTGAPDTFVANVEGDWLYPDRSDPDHLLHIAKQCPSGAIQIVRKDDGLDEHPPQVNTARIYENGPYAVHAEIILDGKADGTRRVLCRCGLSAKKPYCDGSHKGDKDDQDPFIASGEPETRDMTMMEERGGPLRINPQMDGPLMVSGPVEILAGTGRGIERTQTCRLCRCGASQNKPFCDGSHARVGFKTD